MVAENCNSNKYEAARKQRLDENKKRFQELGILDLSKSLSKLSSPEKKAKRLLKSSVADAEFVEPRRSSRARTTVTSYRDDVDIDLSPLRKRTRFSSSSSWTSYIARPLNEVKLASYEDRDRALRIAKEFQTNLQSANPSFVKTMVRSHVYSCFWLGLPTQFCKNYLPRKDLDMILEDENGSTYDAKYLGSRTGLSGGWRGFALDHKLDDGDAVVFELVESNKFKVYTFRISSSLSSRTQDVAKEEGSAKAKNASVDKNKSKSDSTKKQNSKKVKAKVKANASRVETSELLNDSVSEIIDRNSTEKNGVEETDGKDESAVNKEVKSLQKNAKQEKNAVKPRKKPAPRLLRRRV